MMLAGLNGLALFCVSKKAEAIKKSIVGKAEPRTKLED